MEYSAMTIAVVGCLACFTAGAMHNQLKAFLVNFGGLLLVQIALRVYGA